MASAVSEIAAASPPSCPGHPVFFFQQPESCGKLNHILIVFFWCVEKLDDGWPESEKRVFQASLSMVVVKNSR